MKVLVLGAGGQLGRELLTTAPHLRQVTGCSHTQLDVCNPAAIERTFDQIQPNLVINAAAYTAVDRAETDPEAAHAVNARAPRRIAEHCASRNIALVHVSTDFVFRGDSSRPYRPTDEVGPLGVYGASKLAGETAVREVLPEALVLRTAWLYSARGANFVNTMLRLMSDRDELNVVSDQIGTPTSARGLADAIWRSVERNLTGIHHWTDAGAASWYDFAEAIAEEAHALGLLKRRAAIRPVRTEDYPTAARRPPYGLLDKTETWAALALTPPHWRVQLRAVLRQLRDITHA